MPKRYGTKRLVRLAKDKQICAGKDRTFTDCGRLAVEPGSSQPGMTFAHYEHGAGGALI